MALTHVIAYGISDDHHAHRTPQYCKPTEIASSGASSSQAWNPIFSQRCGTG